LSRLKPDGPFIPKIMANFNDKGCKNDLRDPTWTERLTMNFELLSSE